MLLAGLLKSIRDLNAQAKELGEIRNGQGKVEKVDVVVQGPEGRDIGFKKDTDGVYQVVADNAGLSPEQAKRQQDFIKQIRQRYSYNKVLEQLKKQGYIIAEEEKTQGNTIRILARKWS
jgi:hypothetical protein